ncbi:hypothetical protein PR048_003545 [Dryococelus australis]|uniref:Uncharacterized protein n=1 Tax=Dryococelus australis TaxID=614101 RepID=A0ABQ9IND0_9NEOP|nr:hypothetical protein PR048_003545 [Dryococelus australis]
MTGCDTLSSFSGRGKLIAWDAWTDFPEATDTFVAISEGKRLVSSSKESMFPDKSVDPIPSVSTGYSHAKVKVVFGQHLAVCTAAGVYTCRTWRHDASGAVCCVAGAKCIITTAEIKHSMTRDPRNFASSMTCRLDFLVSYALIQISTVYWLIVVVVKGGVRWYAMLAICDMCDINTTYVCDADICDTNYVRRTTIDFQCPLGAICSIDRDMVNMFRNDIEKWISHSPTVEVGKKEDPRENPPTRQARFPLAKIWEQPGRGLNPFRLRGRRAAICHSDDELLLLVEKEPITSCRKYSQPLRDVSSTLELSLLQKNNANYAGLERRRDLKTGEYGAATEWKGAVNGRSPRKTRRPVASSGTTPTCENPGEVSLRIEPGSPGWEASILSTKPPRPRGLLRRLVTLTLNCNYWLEEYFTSCHKHSQPMRDVSSTHNILEFSLLRKNNTNFAGLYSLGIDSSLNTAPGNKYPSHTQHVYDRGHGPYVIDGYPHRLFPTIASAHAIYRDLRDSRYYLRTDCTSSFWAFDQLQPLAENIAEANETTKCDHQRHAKFALLFGIRLNFTVLYLPDSASFLHWLLHRSEATPVLIQLHGIGLNNCEVFIAWCRVTQGVSDNVLSNVKLIEKGARDFFSDVDFKSAHFIVNSLYRRERGPRWGIGYTTRLPPWRTGLDSRRGHSKLITIKIFKMSVAPDVWKSATAAPRDDHVTLRPSRKARASPLRAWIGAGIFRLKISGQDTLQSTVGSRPASEKCGEEEEEEEEEAAVRSGRTCTTCAVLPRSATGLPHNCGGGGGIPSDIRISRKDFPDQLHFVILQCQIDISLLDALGVTLLRRLQANHRHGSTDDGLSHVASKKRETAVMPCGESECIPTTDKLAAREPLPASCCVSYRATFEWWMYILTRNRAQHRDNASLPWNSSPHATVWGNIFREIRHSELYESNSDVEFYKWAMKLYNFLYNGINVRLEADKNTAKINPTFEKCLNRCKPAYRPLVDSSTNFRKRAYAHLKVALQ